MTITINNQGTPWWNSGVLEPAKHQRLIENRFSVGRRAGLSPPNHKYMWEPLSERVTDLERGWCKKVITGEHTGLGFRYSGPLKQVNVRMHELTGGFLRNFVDATIMQSEDIVGLAMTGGSVQATVLFIPDLGLLGSKLTEVPRRALVGVLTERARNGKHTSVYAPHGLKKQFGDIGEDLEGLLAHIEVK